MTQDEMDRINRQTMERTHKKHDPRAVTRRSGAREPRSKL